jgi:DNA-binding transcriptional MerR regulator
VKWHSFVISIPLLYGRGSDGTDYSNRNDRRGHRLFNDDIDRIREIKRWIDNGVQVSKVKCCSAMTTTHVAYLARTTRNAAELFAKRQSAAPALWIKERVATTRTNADHPSFHSLTPTSAMPAATLQALLSMLDGVLINYIAFALPQQATNRKRCAGGRLERARYHPLWLEGGSPASRAGAWMSWRTRWPAATGAV